MPVDLFGQPADYDALEPIARREGLKLLCDTAQGFGGLLDGRRAGAIGTGITALVVAVANSPRARGSHSC